jgi:hypothetical protein
MSSPDDLVEIFSTSDPNEAEVLRIALKDEGLNCEIDGKGQGGFTGIGVMEVKLFVRASDAGRARAYLEKHLQKP